MAGPPVGIKVIYINNFVNVFGPKKIPDVILDYGPDTKEVFFKTKFSAQ